MGKKKGVMSRQKVGPKDFEKKKKRKVGKKKPDAANDTKTDFKVKQVQMPAQHALDEKGEEVTQKRLGLWELLAHMQHHSGKVRREALEGLQELCSAHEGVLGKNLARIVEGTTTAAIDNYDEVREQFRKFQSWLLGALPSEALVAFAPTLALQVRSALSHVSHEVRKDGLLLLEVYVGSLTVLEVLSLEETLRVIKILCQMQSHSETVLSCLFKLLQPQPPVPPGAAGLQRPLAVLLDKSEAVEGADSESPIWGLCLRVWLQAGDLSGNAEAATKPAWTKLRVAAVLERALMASRQEWGLRPSAAQLAQLAAVVRRGEWPLRPPRESAARQAADSANLIMARVLALLAASSASREAYAVHLHLLVGAVLDYLPEATPAVCSAAGGAAVAASSNTEVKVLSGPAAVASLLRTLELLWSCCVPQARTGLSLAPQEVERLASCTAALLDSAGGDEEAGSAALLSVPLAASLLGLRPSANAVPPALRAAWPEALAAVGEPCLAGLLCGGSVQRMACAWPKLLWYLGGSEPALSTFPLTMLLGLAKAAAAKGSLHAELWQKACPLLAPFLAGRAEAKPTLALLPPEAQCLAAMLLPHFPRITEAVATVLMRLVCRQEGLCDRCRELILEAVLTHANLEVAAPLQLRLKAALTVLNEKQTALQLVDGVAAFVMAAPPPVPAAYDERRLLLFQTLAWPLCQQAAAASAPRALCFLFFCAARLPDAPHATGLDWQAWLQSAFAGLLPAAFEEENSPRNEPLCEPGRAGGLPWHEMPAARAMARLFVSAVMRVVPVPQRPGAYELLAKLCYEGRSSAAAAWLLAEAISYRNEKGLATEAWGSLGGAETRAWPAEELKARLRRWLGEAQGSAPGSGAAALRALEALLPLL